MSQRTLVLFAVYFVILVLVTRPMGCWLAAVAGHTPLPGSLRAIDGAFARWDDVPRDGAEIAFIPPVSGG